MAKKYDFLSKNKNHENCFLKGKTFLFLHFYNYKSLNLNQLVRFPATLSSGEVPFDSAQKSTLPHKEQRILHSRPIHNQEVPMRPAAAPARPIKKLFNEIPVVGEITMDKGDFTKRVSLRENVEEFSKISNLNIDDVTKIKSKEIISEESATLQLSLG